MLILKESFEKLLMKVPYLLSYKHPVDHFKLRKQYDEYKHAKEGRLKRKANSIYFYRALVQDGSFDYKNKKRDKFLRALIDTLTLELRQDLVFLKETVRYDLERVLVSIEKHISRYGKRGITKRLNLWEEKIKRHQNFYKSLLKKEDQEISLKVLDKRLKGRYILKDFVVEKMNEVYNFWKNEREIYRALFVLETILYNEVGSYDGKYGLERKDVAQVVLNRFYDSKYNRLDESNLLWKKLKKSGLAKKDQSKWLNVMLKKESFLLLTFLLRKT